MSLIAWKWLGIDIGGANVKTWSLRAGANNHPFELWRSPKGLSKVIGEIAQQHAPFDAVAITMTGELCDCFPDRVTGVLHIINSVAAITGSENLFCYGVDGDFHSFEESVRNPPVLAAANWHAIARAASRFLPHQSGLVVDIGSTTTDLVPVRDGMVSGLGKTDWTRMLHGELLYTGAARSPVCAICNSIEIRLPESNETRFVQPAMEWFASIADVYTILGQGPLQPEQGSTMDRRPGDVDHCLSRLARAFCSDREEMGDPEVVAIASQIAKIHKGVIGKSIREAVNRNSGPGGSIFVSGSGEWLGLQIVTDSLPEQLVVSASRVLSGEISSCLAAWSVAILACESGVQSG